MTFRKNYTNDDIIRESKNVKSISQLLKKLGLKQAGGNYYTIKHKLQQLNINTTHWTGKSWNKNEQLKNWKDYKKIPNLKKHLIKLRGQKCECCSNKHWMNQNIPLEVHHIDGNRTNNQLNNLLLLCPNCHSLTDNYRGKKNKMTTVGVEPTRN